MHCQWVHRGRAELLEAGVLHSVEGVRVQGEEAVSTSGCLSSVAAEGERGVVTVYGVLHSRHSIVLRTRGREGPHFSGHAPAVASVKVRTHGAVPAREAPDIRIAHLHTRAGVVHAVATRNAHKGVQP